MQQLNKANAYQLKLQIYYPYQPCKRQPHKMVKYAETIYRLLPTNCLNVLDHFVGLTLKGLRLSSVL